MSKDFNVFIYESEKGEIELRTDTKKETIWATQAQIADVFDTTIPNVNIHLGNIFTEGELVKEATIKESLIVQKEGVRVVKRPIELYNLDAIIAVGYRVSSKKATQFRIWATRILREYITKGYNLNHYKLGKHPESLVGLYDAVSMLESEDVPGKLKGKITIKLTKELEPRK